MSEQNDGGPAFPTGLTPGHYSQEGMSLRVWFAGHATEDDISAHRKLRQGQGFGNYECTREEAKYAYADAMIAARAPTQPQEGDTYSQLDGYFYADD